MYTNYGDVDFFEYGILVEKESDTEFSILRCVPYSDEENLYMFALLHVDVNDDWIDRDAVMSYLGMNEFDPIHFAIGCTDYYSWENFGADNYGLSYDWRRMTKETIQEELKYYM